MKDEEVRQQFLDEIKNNPYDISVRAIFADWLDEHDEPEEAELFRSWTLDKHQEAEDWIKSFALEINNETVEYYAYEQDGLSYDKLIMIGHDHLDNGRQYCLPFDTPDTVYDNRDKFWDCFEIVTGRRVNRNEINGTVFRCAC